MSLLDLMTLWDRYESRRRVTHYGTPVCYHHGRYQSADARLRALERSFSYSVPRLRPALHKAAVERRHKQPYRLAATYLLAWDTNNRLTQTVLLALLNDQSSHSMHNAAAWALFPRSINRRVDVERFLCLMEHGSYLCQNKAAGILAFSRLSDHDRKRIGQAAAKSLRQMLLDSGPAYRKRAAALLCLNLLRIPLDEKRCNCVADREP
jgi:hypothetical protein